jgi:hypothetical protein
VWNTVVANDFHARAELLADEIAMNRPDAVGLQEAFLWRTQSPSDPATPATHVVYDYISELLAALDARGTSYEVAESIELLDIETPTLMGIDSDDPRAEGESEGRRSANARGTRAPSVADPGQPVPGAAGLTAVDLRSAAVGRLLQHPTESFAPVGYSGDELAGILAATPGRRSQWVISTRCPHRGAVSVAGVGSPTPGQTSIRRMAHLLLPERLAETEPGLDQRIDYVLSGTRRRSPGRSSALDP